MKKIIFCLLIVLTIGCTARKNNASEEVEVEMEPVVTKTILDSIFISPVLQDTLAAFMQAIDTLPDELGTGENRVVYTIELSKEKKDTILCLSAYFYMYSQINNAFDRSYNSAFGAIKYGNTVVAVNKAKGIMPEDFIQNTERYSREIYFTNTGDFWSRVCNGLPLDRQYPSLRQYKLDGKDRLTLQWSKKGTYEK